MPYPPLKRWAMFFRRYATGNPGLASGFLAAVEALGVAGGVVIDELEDVIGDDAGGDVFPVGEVGGALEAEGLAGGAGEAGGEVAAGLGLNESERTGIGGLFQGNDLVVDGVVFAGSGVDELGKDGGLATGAGYGLRGVEDEDVYDRDGWGGLGVEAEGK